MLYCLPRPPHLPGLPRLPRLPILSRLSRAVSPVANPACLTFSLLPGLSRLSRLSRLPHFSRLPLLSRLSLPSKLHARRSLHIIANAEGDTFHDPTPGAVVRSLLSYRQQAKISLLVRPQISPYPSGPSRGTHLPAVWRPAWSPGLVGLAAIDSRSLDCLGTNSWPDSHLAFCAGGNLLRQIAVFCGRLSRHGRRVASWASLFVPSAKSPTPTSTWCVRARK